MKTELDSMVGKVAIITGGNKGIGEGCAKVFCEAGMKVVICGRNVDDLITVQSKLVAGGGVCKYIKCDVSSEDDMKALINFTVEQFGRIDCIINNAGYYPQEKMIDDLSVEELEKILRNNFVSEFMGCKYALPYLRKTQGSIINMSSVTGIRGTDGALAYTSSKGAINSFTRTLAIMESRYNVRVNAILPGHINTPMYYQSKEDANDPEAFEAYSNSVQWLGRGGEIEEVGKACLFLASDMASYVTGVELLVTGGYEIGEGTHKYRLDWAK